MIFQASLTDIAELSGLGFGLAGFILGVLNFRRDNPRVVVELQWDLSVTPGTQYDSNKLWGVVRVANVGRRPIYISHAALKLPEGYGHSHLILMEGVAGRKLAEGDAPQVFMVSQDELEQYAAKWHDIRAQVSDSAGKVWYSQRFRRDLVPSWARADQR